MSCARPPLRNMTIQKLLTHVLLYIGTTTVLSLIAAVAFLTFTNSFDDVSKYTKKWKSGYAECSVLGINVHGTMLTYTPFEADGTDSISSSEDVVAAIRAAGEDDSLKAVLLEIDSPGGLPVAGEEIANALKELKKPSVAIIRQSGTSAAYWAATGAKYVIASKNSDVGSIGVTMSYLENIDATKKYIQLSSGKYKDTGSPDKPISDEEKKLLLRDILVTHENFISEVATNRNIDIAQVRALADGSSVLGDKALELHLIDEIGSWSEGEKYLEQQIGKKPVVCW